MERTKPYGETNLPQIFTLLNLDRKIPLNLLAVNQNGESRIQRDIVMTAREETYEIDTTRPYKLNAGTSGVCAFLLEMIKSMLICHRSCLIHARAHHHPRKAVLTTEFSICNNRPYGTYFRCHATREVGTAADECWSESHQRNEN